MNAKEYLQEKRIVEPSEIWFVESIENEIINWNTKSLIDILEDYHKQKLKSKIKLKEIDFDKPIQHQENNDFSQALFKDNEKIFRGQ